MLKKFGVLLVFLASLNASAALLFDYQSTSLIQAKYALGFNTLNFIHQGTPALTSGPAGTFGGTYLDMSSANVIPEFIAPGNTPTTSAISVLMRLVPINSGNPAALKGILTLGQSRSANTGAFGGWGFAITTGGQLFVTGGKPQGAGAGANYFNGTTCGTPFTFTANVPTDIWVTWDGSTTAGAFKIYQAQNGFAATLLCSMTSSAAAVAPSFGDVTDITGWDAVDLVGNNVFHWNELAIYDDVENPPGFGARTGFVTSTAFQGYTYTDPGVANVASGTTYTYAGNLKTGTLAAPNAADLRNGTVVGSVTGTLKVPSPTQVLSGVQTDNTVGTYITPATSVVKVGQTFGPSGALTGTYDGSDRYTDPGAANVLNGLAYAFNSTSNNRTGTLLSVDPGIANVLLGVNYSINSVGKTGTYSPSCSDPGFHNVKHGVTYVFNATLYTGDYRGYDLWSDPIFNNVSNGVHYNADGVAMIGTLSSVNNVMVLGTLTSQAVNASKPQQNALNVTQGDDVTFNFLAVTGPSNTPMNLSGAVLTSYIQGRNYDSSHHALANQGTSPGQFSLLLSGTESALLRASSNQEVITKVVQSGKTFYLHGIGILRILSPTPGQN